MRIFSEANFLTGVKFGQKQLSVREIEQKLDELYRTDRGALGELLSAAQDDAYIFPDTDVVQRLTRAGLLTKNRSIPPQVSIQLCKYYFTED